MRDSIQAWRASLRVGRACAVMALASVLLCAPGCDGDPPPSISPSEDGGSRSADAGPFARLGPAEPSEQFTTAGAAPSVGWTAPPTCPNVTQREHCPACWTHDDGGAVSLDRNEAGDAFGAAVAVADFNGDGYPDAAVGAPTEDIGMTSNAGRVYVYLGSSTGFQPWRIIEDASPSANAELGSNLIAADFDGDARAELIVAYGGSVSNTPILRYEDNGTTFELLQTLTLKDVDPNDSSIATSELGHAFALGDFLGTGDLSLAVGAPGYEVSSNAVGAVFLLSSSGGTLAESSILTPSNDPGSRCGHAVATLPQSTSDHVVLGCPGDARVYVYDDTTQQSSYSSDIPLSGFGHSLAVGDLDGDGNAEIVAGGDDSGKLELEIVDQQASIPVGLMGSTADRLRVLGLADFDLDGNLDVLGVADDDGGGDHDLVMYLGDGALGSDGFNEISGGTGHVGGDRFAERAVIADIDGNAYVDILVTAPGPSSGGGRFHTFLADASDPGEYWSLDPNPSETVDQETALDASCDECAATLNPDGVACGDHSGAEICVFGACVTRACGDGYRQSGSEGYTNGPVTRESCDDGNTVGGDACSADCSTTELVIVASNPARSAAPSRRAQSVAEDGLRNLVFVFQEDAGETRTLQARRSSYGGVLESSVKGPIAQFSVGWDSELNVAGLPGGGWVLVWTDPEEDGAGSGIAMRRLELDGTLGPVVVANEHAEGEQYQPRVVALDGTIVVAWTDASGRDGPLGMSHIEVRTFDTALLPLTGEQAVTDPSVSSGEPALAATDDTWLLAWTEHASVPFGTPHVWAQRFGATEDSMASQVSTTWGSAAAVAALETGAFAVAWVSRDFAMDPMNSHVDVRSAVVSGAADMLSVGTVADAEEFPVGSDLVPAVAGLEGADYVVAYEDGAERRGLAFVQEGGTAAAESTELAAHLVDRVQGDIVLARSVRGGAWFAWSTDLRGIDGGMGSVSTIVEAESPTAQGSFDTTHAWTTRTSVAGYSGTGYVVAEPTSPEVTCAVTQLSSMAPMPPGPCGAWVEYTFSLSGPASIRPYFRYVAANTNDDSLHWQVDDGPIATDTLPVSASWAWQPAAGFRDLDTGSHTLRVFMADNGLALDQVELVEGIGAVDADRSFVAFLLPPN